MTRRPGFLAALSLLAGLSPAWTLARLDAPKPEPDLAGYKTVETALSAPIIRGGAKVNPADLPAYLGILFDPETRKDVVVTDVDPDSPASKGGLRPGDILRQLDGQALENGDRVLEVLRGKSAGEALEVEATRDNKPLTARVVLTPWSRPRTAQNRPRSLLGAKVVAVKQGEGVLVDQVSPGSAADRAKLKVGEVILKIDDVTLNGPDQFDDLIESKAPESTVVATLLLAEKAVDLKIKLDADSAGDSRAGANGFPQRVGGGGGYWTKPTFRLAIVCVEYPDVKHNPVITTDAWMQALFSEGTYNKTNVTGQAVHGSFRDYFLEQSCGTFRVEGKVFDWVEVEKKRADYGTGNRNALLTESLDKLLARDGKDALKDFDGVFYIYAGARQPALEAACTGRTGPR